MISLVLLRSDLGLLQLHLESKLRQLNLLLLVLMVDGEWGLEQLEQLLLLYHQVLLKEEFFHERGEECQLIQLICHA
jgi:hypothetical protein